MKTLREYMDQLDEISRRDFLKGAGATAGLAAMGGLSSNAQAQNIDYNAWTTHAVNKAITALRQFKSVLVSPRRITFEEYVKNVVTDSITWYMSTTNAYNLEKVINEVTAIAYNAADQEGIGIGDLIGGELTDNVAVKATNTFGRTYKAAVEQKANEYRQTVGQQQQQQTRKKEEMGNLTEQEFSVLVSGVLLYLFAKEDNSPIFKKIQPALNKFIQTHNNKDQVNKLYNSLKQLVDVIKADPDKINQSKKQAYANAEKTISELTQATTKGQQEFKEEELEEASDDAVARILELSKNK